MSQSMPISCFLPFSCMPNTPNLDELQRILRELTQYNEIERSLFERANKYDLCEWTSLVCQWLPAISSSFENSEEMVKHFSSIKKFYSALNNSDFSLTLPKEIQVFFDAINSYEVIMAVAVLITKDYTETMKQVSNALKVGEEKVTNFKVSCINMIFCGPFYLHSFSNLLSAVENAVCKMNVNAIGNFVLGIRDVFCKYFDTDLSDFTQIHTFYDIAKNFIDTIKRPFRVITGTEITDETRDSKWELMNLTKDIYKKISKFDKSMLLIRITIDSLNRFYTATYKCDENVKSDFIEHLRTTKYSEHDNQLDSMRSYVLKAKQESLLRAKCAATCVQSVELLIACSILVIKDEEKFLQPFSKELDKCSEILEKFVALHPLYKLLRGPNYLSRLKIHIKEIIKLVKESKLKLNTASEFLSDLRIRFPELVRLLADDVFDGTLKKKLPEPLEKMLDGAFDSVLKKFKQPTHIHIN